MESFQREVRMQTPFMLGRGRKQEEKTGTHIKRELAKTTDQLDIKGTCSYLFSGFLGVPLKYKKTS